MVAFDPIRLWILGFLAVLAFVPARRVVRVLADRRRRNDRMRLPPVDTGKADEGLVRPSLLLAGVAAVAVLVCTPQAKQFATGPLFYPVLVGLFGLAGLASVVAGWRNGKVSPLVRGNLGPYERSAQPKRYWASMAWNAAFAALMLLVAGASYRDVQRRACTRDDASDLITALASCDALIDDGFASDGDRAALLMRRATLHWANKDGRAALRDATAAVALDPADDNQVLRAAILHNLKRDAEALRALNIVLARSPDHYRALRVRADVYWAMGEDDLARDDDDRTMAMDFPKSP